MSLEGLVCPRDHEPLAPAGDRLVCPQGHAYPVVDGAPVLLVEEERPTHAVFRRSLDLAAQGSVAVAPRDGATVDPVVQELIAATCGNLYLHLVGNVHEYPIPEIRLPPGDGRRFLELGSSWGRWCVSAARRGYSVVGLDPSLEAVLAAGRVARELGVEADYVVGDSRNLPFADASFDVVFSYSVLQHFAYEDARATLVEAGRVLRPGGTALIQLANRYGLRSFQNRLRSRFAAPVEFDIRYWTPRQLLEAFTSAIGPSELEVDGFFSLNAQVSDLHLMPRRARAVVHASEGFRRLAGVVRPLEYVADSLYVRARRRA